ncbi:MAG: Unknown protein [uncultured Thiotrichaceae bacterium]|uniref:Lipoprotein n=1 Tax=uncultured Thiotrichaceae bacterium TaxID=298394 RepID=A0A6S6SB26_9GAMM|nr:MAG: Unknown protein [uncultured Thiotrichaceae bacterium]
MSSKFDWLALVPLCLVLTACSSGEIAVKEAAQQRWNALVDGDLHTAYQHYTDAFKKEVPLRYYRKQVKGVGLWSKAKVDAVRCDDAGNSCDAQVEITVAMKMRGLADPVETTDVVNETWVREGVFSDWRYLKK